ncbi:virion core protein [Deerpox virus W-848-83]|uniref:Assembly protein G7 n=1 Tax=Deerpox virus (strain Mule deer/United States/W-848-83/1983) TaxID=305674 RepID=Q08FT6_DPV83|nr:Virion core protein [Deerpox virus W-848-83]ABI99221.1 virion core protein [Deerpox virus W-848-83]
MIEPKQSAIYTIVSKAIVKSVVKDTNINSEYIENKAKQLCYCNNMSYKESIINNIYSYLEHEINMDDISHLNQILNNLKHQSMYVCNTNEFWRLYNSLTRFTHCKSFFTTCMPTIITTLSMFITLILSNKLLYAAEMVEYIETYLFSSQKNLSQELADLLDMKYALINLVQYKIFPIILGNKDSAMTPIIFSAGSSNIDYRDDIDKLLNLPVKSDMIQAVYAFLTKKGINTSNNFAEYVAGLKIEELSENNNIDEQKNDETSKEDKQIISIQPLTQEERNSMYAMKLLKDAQKYSKGNVLDGSISSPITKKSIINQIPFSASDIEMFAILEYLYIMRVIASNIKRKNLDCKNQGITLNISSPFKSITIPGVNSIK